MKRLVRILGIICFVLGLCFLLYDPILGFISTQKMNYSVSEFKRGVDNDLDISQNEQIDDNNIIHYDLYSDMKEYNENLYETNQSGLVDAWSYEQSSFDLSRYGLETDVIGILYIPVMEVNLPVYLGASKDNMAKGVAIMGQTSMPVGGINTNCVIAGHRGYYGALLFREIEKLEPGDFVYLTTYWDTKTYQVESTDIILPNDIDAILIQDGKEMLTLISCEPYVEATHRIVVYCTVVDDDSNVYSTNIDNSTVYKNYTGIELSESEKRIKLEKLLFLIAIPLTIVAIIIMIYPQKKK